MCSDRVDQTSIVDDLVSAFPSDMPDLRDSTNHLAPLKMPAQLSMYMPGREDRWGFQVESLSFDHTHMVIC